MSRILHITQCESCPNKDHKGGFGNVSYVPICNAMNGREIPHDIGRAGFGGRLVVASLKPGFIPEWCPLEKAED